MFRMTGMLDLLQMRSNRGGQKQTFMFSGIFPSKTVSHSLSLRTSSTALPFPKIEGFGVGFLLKFLFLPAACFDT